MSDLPERADLDQLRRQARELLRAAVAGEPEAAAALSAVSDRLTLAAAQLVIAREHGFGSWPALRAEIASRRASRSGWRPDWQSVQWGPRADAGQQEAPTQRSFAGAGAITVEEGELTPRIVVAGPDGAFLEASLVVSPEAIDRIHDAQIWFPELPDVTITDDQGSAFTLGGVPGCRARGRGRTAGCGGS